MSEDGKLADFADLSRVGAFSRAFHAAFVNWPMAVRHGAWSTWRATVGDANYLLLKITAPSPDGEMCDPIFVWDEFDEMTVGARVGKSVP